MSPIRSNPTNAVGWAIEIGMMAYCLVHIAGGCFEARVISFNLKSKIMKNAKSTSVVLKPVFVLVNISKGLYGISKDYDDVQRLADWTNGNFGVIKTIWTNEIENVSFDGITISHPNVAVQSQEGYLEFE